MIVAPETFALETVGLEKRFGGLAVTRDLSLKIAPGARHALIGPNGAGKTTVINLLTGVLRPDGGMIRLGGEDITRLGEPRLFWGVTGGCVDSMVANHTASKKRRHQDDYTPGGVNDRRPDRATIVYTTLIRRHFKNTVPVVLGGIEASLRRVAHYDFWSDSLRRSILLDAKADYLLYGMAEESVLALAKALRAGEDLPRPSGTAESGQCETGQE